MQPVWICILSKSQFEDTFENTQKRKVKQIKPVFNKHGKEGKTSWIKMMEMFCFGEDVQAGKALGQKVWVQS